MPLRAFGFELNNGAVAQVQAYSLAEAIAQAEAEHGSRVHRGRCLEHFDNEAAPGRPPWLVEGTRRPTIPVPS